MKHIPILIGSFLLLMTTHSLMAQDCTNVLPEDKEWTAYTVNGSAQSAGVADHITITSKEAGTYLVSDLSAGFFKANGVEYAMSGAVRLDCNGNAIVTTLISDFGEAIITSGVWNSEEKVLTVSWGISLNNLEATSIFKTQ